MPTSACRNLSKGRKSGAQPASRLRGFTTLEMARRLHSLQRAARDHLKRMLRIEKITVGPTTTIRLIGRIRAELLEELSEQIKKSGPLVVLDLEEVSLVDVDAVRFLGARQSEGISLVHCSPYITDWIARE